MDREALHRHSKADLVELVLRQQDEIERLRASLARRDAPTESATPTSQAQPTPSPLTPQADLEVEHEAAVHKALMHLDDLSYLRHSPLVHWLGRLPRSHSAGAVQVLLRETIEDLKRTSYLPTDLRPLMYTIIYSHFVEKKRAVDVMRALALSPRQYFRHQKTAIQAITHLLFESQR